jgi:K(+)-stimulated pyrophosphate-energized sodium pump
MNMVSLLALGLVIKYNVITGTAGRLVGLLVALLCAAAIGWSIWQSKRESKEMKEMEKQFEQ